MDVNFYKILSNYGEKVTSSVSAINLGHVLKKDYICNSFVDYIFYRMKDIYKKSFSSTDINESVEDLYNRIK